MRQEFFQTYGISWFAKMVDGLERTTNNPLIRYFILNFFTVQFLLKNSNIPIKVLNNIELSIKKD
ncbi:hypothetical protein P872_22080 [Rhodonellum psychrophilum GCM71 = DSM 17998]|uniref:Uncharacterized protein n=1 Tax=Rhodonellum psychrophilum GCM71 = DSM 17998 TaxID=1123057 RepID=U5BQT2_9BACT|nr:hypothetical protein P872_22080 [Rhodonellum psychrophilum GCM71 = DSM 17998]